MNLLRFGRTGAVMLAMAAATWLAALAGRWFGWLGLLGLIPVAVTLIRRPDLAVIAVFLALAGWWSGHGSAIREAAILSFSTPEGRFEAGVRLLGDPRREAHGWWALAVPNPPEPGRPPAIPLLVSFESDPEAMAGETLLVEGRRTGRTGTARGKPYSGVVSADSWQAMPSRAPPWLELGNRVRKRALERLEGRGTRRALLAGFLVGETSGVPEADQEAMRSSGLTHLVAVSGSNVSLFLTLAVVAAGPLAAGPRRRAVVGLIALVVLVAATRWEPSVVRASAMAAILLGGRIGGWAPDAFTALAATVVGVVVVSGEMSTDVGFAMSVLATLGVLVGANLFAGFLSRPVATLAGATLGAQLAVAPIVLTVFGTVPLMAPIANLVAVPVVSATTVVATIGVTIGWEPLLELASLGAGLVLAVARFSAGWPQLGWVGYGFSCVCLASCMSRRLRPWVVVGVAVVVGFLTVAPPTSLPLPAAVVLDVGQGDAILVRASDGSALLVDGGPDPAVLDRKLTEYGITSLDLVVLTHVHADHATGLQAVVGRRPVGELWLPTAPHITPAAEEIFELVEAAGIRARTPPVGRTLLLGDLTLEVLAPLRRYASPNDQSAVLRISTPGGPRLLLTGDIETHAQADLGPLAAEVLKVPHQGGATSDLGWLQEVGASWAVISVGPNDYGHPSPEVIDALEAAGARISRTDLDGDVVVPLGPHVDVAGESIETPRDVSR